MKSHKKFMEFKKPTTIKYAKEPGGLWKEKSVSEIEKEFGIEWTERLYYDENDMKKCKEVIKKIKKEDFTRYFQKHNQDAFTDRDQSSLNSTENVVLFDMGPYGHGAFSSEDLESVYFFDGGEMSLVNPHDAAEAEKKIGRNGYSATYEIDNFMISINSEKYRNMFSFIQHAPTQADLDEEYCFVNPEVKKKVAIANLTMEVHQFGDRVPIAVYVGKKIKANQLLLGDYGSKYWPMIGKAPVLFTKEGKILDPTLYLGPIYLKIPDPNEKRGCTTIHFSGIARRKILTELQEVKDENFLLPIANGSNVLCKTIEFREFLSDPTKIVLEIPRERYIEKEELESLLKEICEKDKKLINSQGKNFGQSERSIEKKENNFQMELFSSKDLGLALREAAANQKVLKEDFERLLKEICEKDKKLINSQGKKFGQTSLHLAVRSGNNDKVKLLLTYGADITLKDTNEEQPKTAYDYAIELKYCQELLELLNPSKVTHGVSEEQVFHSPFY